MYLVEGLQFKSKSKKPESGFVEVKSSGRTFSAGLEIIFPSGARLIVSGKADPGFIRSLIF